jgi:hypothetical protein
MNRRLYPWMFLLGGVLIGLVASSRIVLHAQEPTRNSPVDPIRTENDFKPSAFSGNIPTARPEADTTAASGPARTGTASVQDALFRSYHFPFQRPTALTQVCLHLKQTLGVPVVLDIAALQRQDVTPDDTVQLELDGVRLKTGLKLLLDQVGLTYHVIAEDNLLLITDREGSEDPLDRIWDELRKLHRDLHDVQDTVDDVADALYGEAEEGPKVRKPTIIEEKPDGPNPPTVVVPEDTNPAPKAPEQKPDKNQAPKGRRGVRPTPSRVPLASPRRWL